LRCTPQKGNIVCGEAKNQKLLIIDAAEPATDPLLRWIIARPKESAYQTIVLCDIRAIVLIRLASSAPWS